MSKTIFEKTANGFHVKPTKEYLDEIEYENKQKNMPNEVTALKTKVENLQLDNTVLMMAVAELEKQNQQLRDTTSVDNTVLMMAIADLNQKISSGGAN